MEDEKRGMGKNPANQQITFSGLFNKEYLKSLPWQPMRAGIEYFPIHGEPGKGPAAALLKYAPGALLPLHRHGGYEHIIILTEHQQDDSGKYEAGTIVVNKPGSQHRVMTPNGGIALVIWEKPVEFVYFEK
jgi:anti-sigma factor ChrR (cupin superfamily)